VPVKYSVDGVIVLVVVVVAVDEGPVVIVFEHPIANAAAGTRHTLHKRLRRAAHTGRPVAN
jgi:hypothetical protein